MVSFWNLGRSLNSRSMIADPASQPRWSHWLKKNSDHSSVNFSLWFRQSSTPETELQPKRGKSRRVVYVLNFWLKEKLNYVRSSTQKVFRADQTVPARSPSVQWVSWPVLYVSSTLGDHFFSVFYWALESFRSEDKATGFRCWSYELALDFSFTSRSEAHEVSSKLETNLFLDWSISTL